VGGGVTVACDLLDGEGMVVLFGGGGGGKLLSEVTEDWESSVVDIAGVRVTPSKSIAVCIALRTCEDIDDGVVEDRLGAFSDLETGRRAVYVLTDPD